LRSNMLSGERFSRYIDLRARGIELSKLHGSC
jgi:hypothetical protein